MTSPFTPAAAWRNTAPAAATTLDLWIDRGFAAALAAGLVWAPFWLGGAWRLPWGVNALLFPGLALGYEIVGFARGRASALAAREIALPGALFLATVAWILLQMTPGLPAPTLAALGAATPATISVDPSAGALALTRLLTDASVFALAAALYSGYGLYLAAAYDNAIPGFQPADGGFEVRATFVNRNAFAAFAGLGLMSALALLTQAATRGRSALEAAGENAAPIAAGLVIVSALIGSASRGGVIAAGAGALTLLAAGGALHGGRLAARLAETGLSDGERLRAYRIALSAIAERPLAGFGYGAFADVFPLFRDATLSPVGVWEMAHNAYLEAAIGLGLVFAGALTLALALVAARCLKAAQQRSGAAPLAASAAAALIAVDALVDYSLEIEAVSLTFMTLLGLGFAQSRAPRAAPC
jgi:O-antigen ligase